jgi:hypothetical protein
VAFLLEISTMARITGAQTKLGIRLGATGTAHGTSVVCGTGHLVPFDSLTWAENAGELTNSPNGLGKVMHSDAIRGAVEPSWSITKKMGYQDGADALLAQIMGTSGSPAEQTVGEADYLHTMTLNPTANAVHATIAWQSSSSTSIELPSATVETITITAENPPSYVSFTASGKANKVELSSTNNDYSDLNSVTLTDDEEIVSDKDDSFWINAESGGALSSSDLVSITRYVLTLNRPQNFVHEYRGTAGNVATLASDLINGTLSVTLRGLADHTYLTAAQAGTSYKCKFSFVGSQIGAGDNKELAIYIPKMKLIVNPDAPISGSGENPVTLNFKILAATANPTGMSSTYPYFTLLNGRSTAYVGA